MEGKSRAAKALGLIVAGTLLCGATAPEAPLHLTGENDSRLIGRWTCADETASMSLETVREYSPDGQSKMGYRLTSLDGSKSIVAMTGVGNWTLEGGILRDHVAEFHVTTLDVAGADMRGTDLEQALIRELQIGPVESRLLSISKSHLILASPETNAELNCTRAP